MKTARRQNCLSAVLFVSAAVLLSARSQGQEQDSHVGQLRLEGKHVERLVLRLKDGGRKEFNKPSETIKLPAGEYQLQEVRLQGGYSCGIMTRITNADWVTVAQDKPAVLKVGAPLKQAIRVERRGSVLVLNYELSGIGGEKYAASDRAKPPTFAVYKGNRKIGSGKFEFG